MLDTVSLAVLDAVSLAVTMLDDVSLDVLDAVSLAVAVPDAVSLGMFDAVSLGVPDVLMMLVMVFSRDVGAFSFAPMPLLGEVVLLGDLTLRLPLPLDARAFTIDGQLLLSIGVGAGTRLCSSCTKRRAV